MSCEPSVVSSQALHFKKGLTCFIAKLCAVYRAPNISRHSERAQESEGSEIKAILCGKGSEHLRKQRNRKSESPSSYAFVVCPNLSIRGMVSESHRSFGSSVHDITSRDASPARLPAQDDGKGG